MFVKLVCRHAHFYRVVGRVGELIKHKRFREAEESLALGSAFSQATAEVVSTLSSARRLRF